MSFPSKTFLLGEYSILEGGTALLLGHPPCFDVEVDANKVPNSPFHAESPAGKWLATHPFVGAISLADPHQGAGGFGASGAEFMAAFSVDRKWPMTQSERAVFAWEAWNAYKGNPGSGADIVTQAYGINLKEAFALAIDTKTQILERLSLGKMRATITLLHTGKKVATHAHLSSRPQIPTESLKAVIEIGINAIRTENVANLAKAIAAYGQVLAKLNLVADHTKTALAQIKGNQILAAKGCGAMGADVILVLHRGADLKPWARENSLVETISLPI